jgi:hypothetical protein
MMVNYVKLTQTGYVMLYIIYTLSDTVTKIILVRWQILLYAEK